VGCSGGVYAIFGMHVAEIIINWDLQHKGIMNHWTRLMVIMFVLAVDFFLYYNAPSEVRFSFIRLFFCSIALLCVFWYRGLGLRCYSFIRQCSGFQQHKHVSIKSDA